MQRAGQTTGFSMVLGKVLPTDWQYLFYNNVDTSLFISTCTKDLILRSFTVRNRFGGCATVLLLRYER